MKFSFLFVILSFVCASCLHSAETAEVKVALTSPVEHQVFQRTSAQGGKILVAGRIHLASKETQTPEALRVRITGEGSEGKWVNLVIDSQVAAFRGELEAPAGGWYGFEAEVLRAGKADAKTAVAHVGMGEDEFIQRHTRIRPDRRGLSLLEKEDASCEWLEGSDCTLQSVKPRQCRAFPNDWNFPGWREKCEAVPTLVRAV